MTAVRNQRVDLLAVLCFCSCINNVVRVYIEYLEAHFR